MSHGGDFKEWIDPRWYTDNKMDNGKGRVKCSGNGIIEGREGNVGGRISTQDLGKDHEETYYYRGTLKHTHRRGC